MGTRHLAILTGGGDVPGLNVAIQSVYHSARRHGWTREGSRDANVTGILRGWKGAVHLGSPPAPGGPAWTLPLTDEIVHTVDRAGGTFLFSSRTRPERLPGKELPARLQARKGELPRVEGKEDLFDVTDEVIANLKGLGVDCLVAIGGDDTLGYAHTLHRRGFPVVAIPKTMDNDVRGTEYAIGFQTALVRSEDYINRQRSHLKSHETVGVFRIFGRNAGFTALGTAMAISDIRCLIPEHRFDLEALCRLVAEDYRRNETRYALVVISEGAIWEGGKIEEYGPADAYGHRYKSNVGEALAAEITRRTGLPTRMQDVTYDLRSGPPEVIDKLVGATYGALAVELIAQEYTGRMVCLKNGVYAHAPLPDPGRGARTVDVASGYDSVEFRPRFDTLLGKPIFP